MSSAEATPLIKRVSLCPFELRGNDTWRQIVTGRRCHLLLDPPQCGCTQMVAGAVFNVLEEGGVDCSAVGGWCPPAHAEPSYKAKQMNPVAGHGAALGHMV